MYLAWLRRYRTVQYCKPLNTVGFTRSIGYLNSLRMSKRSKVAYCGHQDDEPSFLKAFKAKVGYKEPDPEEDMAAKKAKMDKMLNDDSLPDELPTIELGKGVTEADASIFIKT